jgi:maltose O-acetyltransferase
MTEKEKQQQGLLYLASDPTVIADLRRCEEACFEINRMPPSQREERNRRLKNLFGRAGKLFNVVTPFFCDYGYNIEVGEHFFANTNCVILDEAKVTFGDNVFIAPNCSFYTAGHPLEPKLRNAGMQYALPIHVGNNVWIGGNTVVVPGVTIGNNVTIGAGSVVTHDLPDGVLAAGNPCRVIKRIDDAEPPSAHR